jgi:thymidylate synthase
MRTNFKNAREAFIYFYNEINSNGVVFGDTKALFNVGFTLQNPSQKNINVLNPDRKFNLKYAEAEWQWYLSGDPSIDKLGEINGSIPPIWETMADSDRKVRSNYGWQWEREHQLDKVIQMLKVYPYTRQAVLSIYDGKEISTYRNDTPCTYAVQFTILNNKLEMSVLMRSNDLWFGFCNDQYCFASLQELVADRLSIEVGSYYHFAHNLHLYNNKLKTK